MLATDSMLLILLGVFGLCLGSFLNVVIYRLPKQLQANWARESKDFLGLTGPEPSVDASLNIVFPASHCPHCGAAISPWHNIPLLSYLLLRGKCKSCAEPISIQYPLVEGLTSVIFILVFAYYGLTLEGLFVLSFCLAMLILTAIDFQTQLLPDNLTLPLMWLGIIANSLGIFTDLGSAVYGAMAGYLMLWLVYWGFKLLTGKEGMGYGDFKLLAAIGAWVGWQQLPLVILLSSLVGAIVGILMASAFGMDRQKHIAFGPYLAISGLISLFWGERIVNQYLLQLI